MKSETGCAPGSTTWAILVAVLPVMLASPPVAVNQSVDPFTFFQPSVTLDPDDHRQLDSGAPITRILPSEDREIAIFAAVRVDADNDRLLAWMRKVEQLKKSSYVLAIGRFSDPPRIEDLAGLRLDEEDLSEALSCRPRNCGLKLSGDEMRQLQRAVAAAGHDWKPALQLAFRGVVLQRVKTYLTDGQSAVPPYENDGNPVWPDKRFRLVLAHSTFLTARAPAFVEQLQNYPALSSSDVESFVYWAKERLAGKAIISATHVNILRGRQPDAPGVLVAGKQLFATHYINAALGITAMVGGPPAPGRYLVYLNRSDVDALGGMFGGVVRWFVERRVKAEAAEVLQGLRRRLESGDPQTQESGVTMPLRLAPGIRQVASEGTIGRP
jgi:hypothetical protein